MKDALRKVAHVFISTTATAAAVLISSSVPINSRSVLLPALTAGLIAAIHGVLPLKQPPRKTKSAITKPPR